MTEFDTHWLDLPVGRTRVRTVGDGPAILFTHGLLVDGRIWDRVAGPVAERGYRVLLPDLPLGAHTEPVHDRDALTTMAVADTLFDVADALGVDRFAVLGFDTGGALSQVATARRPERVDRLALMSCDAFEHFPPPLVRPFQWAAYWPPAMSLVLASLGNPRLQHWPLPIGLLAKHGIPDELVRSWAGPCATDPAIRADCVAFIRQMRAVDTLAAAEALRTYPGPSMVLWSRRDQFFPRKDAVRLAGLLPHCELRWIDDAYTFASLDNPTRTVELVSEFLALPRPA